MCSNNSDIFENTNTVNEYSSIKFSRRNTPSGIYIIQGFTHTPLTPPNTPQKFNNTPQDLDIWIYLKSIGIITNINILVIILYTVIQLQYY